MLHAFYGSSNAQPNKARTPPLLGWVRYVDIYNERIEGNVMGIVKYIFDKKKQKVVLFSKLRKNQRKAAGSALA